MDLRNGIADSDGLQDLISAITGSRVWRCDTCGPTGEVLATARSRAIRPLTQEERDNFLPQQSGAAGGVGTVVLAAVALAVLVAIGWLVYRAAKARRAPPEAGSAAA